MGKATIKGSNTCVLRIFRLYNRLPRVPQRRVHCPERSACDVIT